VLCTGDLHIGRRASRIPDDLDGTMYSCASAWKRLVDTAIQEQVDVVAISGDVVDEGNKYFEAIGPLEQGIRQLAGHGIMTYAVSGNHDHDVLPTLARRLNKDAFVLIGQGGVWERETFRRNGAVALYIDGWSFPQRSIMTSPLEGYALDPVDDAPVFGLLHGDLDQPNSTYAPLMDHQFTATIPDFWLLGHIHIPREHTTRTGKTLLYPGSPLAMDPGETGWHGAWIAELTRGQPTRLRHLRTSCVRYDTIAVALDGIDDAEEFNDRITGAVQAHVVSLVEDVDGCGDLQFVGCRLRLTGRTRLHRDIGARLAGNVRDLQLHEGPVVARVEGVYNETRPAIDLERLATSADPPGEVARLLIALEHDPDPPEYRELIERTRARMMDIHRASSFAAIASDVQPDTSHARTELMSQGWRLLDALVAQQERA